jgi:hypothetical protein
MVGCGVEVIVAVAGAGEVEVGGTIVGEGGGDVTEGNGVAVTTVAVGETGVNVNVSVMVAVAKVGEGMGEAVGVITIGLPNSLHPRSGAEPMNPTMGFGGMGSPLAAINCATPRSIAGELPCSSRPLKSSSTVSHAPSAPGFGAATKRGS